MTVVANARATVATVTASATLAKGEHTPVDATSGAVTVTLPTGVTIGSLISIEKTDSSVNAVTVSGTIRGGAATIALTSQYHSLLLIAESSSSWRPLSDYRTKAALDAAYISLTGNNAPNYTGTPAGPFLQVANATAQATLHLLASAGFTGPYLLGLGVNQNNAKGLVSDVTNPGAIGIQATLFSGDSATSYGVDLNAGAGSLGTLLSVNTTGSTGLAVDLHAQGTPATGQVLMKIRADVLAGRSNGWGADIFDVYADTGLIDFRAPTVRTNGALVTFLPADPTATGTKDRIDVDGTQATPPLVWRKYSGTAALFWSNRAVASGQTLKFQPGTAAANIGSETWLTALTLGAASSLPVVGLYTATPVPQPTRVGQLTDSSGGTSGGATIAAVAVSANDATGADLTTTRNAIATLAAKVNAMEAKLSAAGGGIGVWA